MSTQIPDEFPLAHRGAAPVANAPSGAQPRDLPPAPRPVARVREETAPWPGGARF